MRKGVQGGAHFEWAVVASSGRIPTQRSDSDHQ
jgi:hypothetical protein